jgi:predicted PurR-regulated permease PerM
MQLELSERQRTTVATAVTILSACVIVVAIGALFYLLGAFVTRFSNVFLPLAVAAVAALVVTPYFEWLRRAVRLPSVIALIVVFLSLLIPVAAFAWFFGALLVEQISDLVSKLPEWWQSVEAWGREKAPPVVAFLQRHDVLQRVQEQQSHLVQGLQVFGTGALSAGAGVLSAVGRLLSWVVLPVYFSFFLLVERQQRFSLESYLPFLKQETRHDVSYLVNEFVDIMVAFFRGQIIIAFLQGLLFAIGFTIVGLKYGFVIGLALGFLNIIPYLGNMVGLGVALPLAFFQPGGGVIKVLWVLVVFALVQMIEGYVLTPRIMGDRTGLHPMTIIVAIFFWGSALGGIMGMILAIPLTAFLVVFWRLAQEKYVQELV